MRYHEIVEAGEQVSTQIANQRTRITNSFGTLQSKEASAADARAAAQKLPFGPERNRRLQNASRREADARRNYNDTRRAANDKISDLMSKR